MRESVLVLAALAVSYGCTERPRDSSNVCSEGDLRLAIEAVEQYHEQGLEPFDSIDFGTLMIEGSFREDDYCFVTLAGGNIGRRIYVFADAESDYFEVSIEGPVDAND